jgi:tetratricopeptide (TPR) repeat protein
MSIRVNVVAAMLMALMSVARADKIADAKQHYLNGAKAYEEGDFQRAIDEYRASYDLSRRPLLLYDLGQAYRKLGNNELSLHSYQQFLTRSTEGRDAEYRESATTQIHQLEALIAEQRKVKTAPPDGVTNPEPEKIVKPPAEPPPPPVEKPAPVVVKPPVVETPPAVVARDARPAHVPVYKRWWFWTILGVAAAGVAVGLGVGLTQSTTNYPSASTAGGTIHF